MSNVSIYDPELVSDYIDIKDESESLCLIRPSHRTKFVRRGNETHLLVYLSARHKLPFIRVPVSALLRSARAYERKYPF
ncbi:hypothetical protein BWP24_21385 [Vibrio campbellii]|uniref:hypothetical protein n=1 Tax=Vibrio campbellii TaxID=680 RepID=UPI0009717F88|nr:hypothetical protein [Vibrio campbellii]APX08728.1 hypothetical protein BWP24_21360 [Vibrio campbellii]APX08732.1 hypothetical protein BWP24_21385 [Vibrio campbellii]